MTNLQQRLEKLSPAQRELLQQRLSGGTATSGGGTAREPIAVVGMACRFPSANNLDAYWDLLTRGGNATAKIPEDRFPVDKLYDPDHDAAGKMISKWACLLDDLSQFDPKFFGIAPREASRMDPQQRMLLEVAWEAMEHAGIPPQQLTEKPTGVFIGVSQVDYIKLAGQYDNFLEMIDAHTGTGNSLSIAANRLSYVFNFSGPSASIDTACSSALVAVHQAVNSLRLRECDAALAGAVNVCITPDSMISLSRARMVSPTGQCRPFHEDADGYVRGEGAGVVVLKRLSDAVAAGDNVLAVIRHTAVNHGGRTSGITAPNGSAQIDVIRTALAGGGVSANDINYVEAHGTGTPLGDPIEVEALGEVYKRHSDADTPVYLTSVKANIGHLEIAAGIAGLIKAILVLEKGQIPAQPGLDKLNPRIRTDGTRIEIPTDAVTMPATGRRLAGVSSFGFGGTNAHAVIESMASGSTTSGSLASGSPATGSLASGSLPNASIANGVAKFSDGNQDHKLDGNARNFGVLTLSARSDASMAELANRYADLIDRVGAGRIGDLCHAAAVTRTHHSRRAAIRVESAEQVLADLRKLASAAGSPTIKRGQVEFHGRGRVAFLCTGQGSQYAGMGRELYDAHPAFRATMDRCDAAFQAERGESLLPVIFDLSNDSKIDETAWTQPALFALEISLAHLWMQWGVTPSLVMGHSVGEYAAACVAGVFSVEDGLRLIAKRGELMGRLPAGGAMAVVFASAESLHDRIAKYEGAVGIAATNGPQNTTVSGDADAVESLIADCDADGLQTQSLVVSHAFHSHHMDPMLDEFEAFAATIDFQLPTIPLISNLTGNVVDEEILTPTYWREHVRGSVRFAEGVAKLAGEELDAMIEIGPAPVLLGMAKRCDAAVPSIAIASLRKGRDAVAAVIDGLGQFFVAGGTIDWKSFDAAWYFDRIDLPTYPFDRQRYWLESEGAVNERLQDALGFNIVHPLLGKAIHVAESTVFQSKLRSTTASLSDHIVQGSTLVPGSAFTEMGFAAAKVLYGPGRHHVEDLKFQQALFLTEVAKQVQTVISPSSGNRSPFRIYSRPLSDADQPWDLNATGTIVRAKAESSPPPPAIDLEAFRAAGLREHSHAEFYQIMSDRNLHYGPTYQILDGLTQSRDGAIAAMDLKDAVIRQLDEITIPPAVGDGAMHAAGGTVPLQADGEYTPYTYLPVSIQSVTAYQDLSGDLIAVARRTSDDDSESPEMVTADVWLTNSDGQCVVHYHGVTLRRLSKANTESERSNPETWLYKLGWTPAPLGDSSDSSTVIMPALTLVLADSAGVGETFANQITDRDTDVVVMTAGESYANPAGENGIRHGVINPNDEQHFKRLISDLKLDPAQLLSVVHGWSIDVENPGDDDNDADVRLRRSQSFSAAATTFLYRHISAIAFKVNPAFLIVTRGGQLVEPSQSPNFLQQEMIGIGRVAVLEFGGFDTRLIDLDPAASTEQSASELVTEWSSKNDETQIAYRGGKRLGARIARMADADVDSSSIPRGTPYRLTVGGDHTIDSLRYKPFRRTAPAGDQVEIRVAATGLNFSDVLKSLGLYPGITDTVVPIGIECAGVVTAIGDGVTRIAVGDEVMGIVPYGFASHATVAEHALVRKPDAIDFEEAAIIPIAFMTAYECLVNVGRLQRGEKVLIHAGAGGVGLAAIQIAQDIGAEVFATAGSDVKRDYLRSIGVQHVMNSRTIDFAETILQITGGDGVDVVLNSLPGDMIDHSLSVLAEYGRFVEIGKVDIYQNKMIGLLPFQKNLSYTAVDLDRMFRQRPAQSQSLLAAVMAKFESGDYQPPNMTVFESDQIDDAFRYMSQRRNIGKIVVAMDAVDDSSTANESDDQVGIHADATYLVTGGLGALGRKVAAWLADQGARTIVLTSRRGASPDVQRELDTIAARHAGLKVIPLSMDVADSKSLANGLQTIDDTLPPLRGVIHAAGVVEQVFMVEMDMPIYDKVTAAKIRGGWNLHRATLNRELDFLVLFSSVSTIVGTMQQSAYGAANAFLDGLAHHRRGLGLPATSINWGPWADVGMAAVSGSDLSSRGMLSLPTGPSLNLMGELVRRGTTQATVMIADWQKLVRAYDALSRSGVAQPLFDHFKTAKTNDEAARAEAEALYAQLMTMSMTDRETRLREYLTDQIAQIMGLQSDDLDIQQSLNTMGLDSLMAIELANKLQLTLKVTLPMSIFIENPTVATLAKHSATAMQGEVPQPAVSS